MLSLLPKILVLAYSQYSIRHKWYFKYDTEKYADVSAICDFLGKDTCLACPSFHALTGCDTASYFYRTGKLRTFKKVLADKTWLILLKSLGQERKLTDAGLESITEFMRLIIFTGKDDECTELSLRHHAYAG